MDSLFYYSVTLHQGPVVSTVVAPWVTALPPGTPYSQPSSTVVVLWSQNADNTQLDGMYLWTGIRWALVIPYKAIAQAIIKGSSIELFYQLNSAYLALPSNTLLWKNATPITGSTNVVADMASVWGAAYVPANGGVGVLTVNRQIADGSGNVTIMAESANMNSGTSLVADSGTTDGTIKVLNLVPGAGVLFSVDQFGNLVINSSAGAISSIDGQTGAVVIQALPNPTGTGQSLVLDSGATTGNIILRNIVGGSGINASIDGSGNIDLTNTGVLTVSGQAPLGGNVPIQASDNNPASGTSLVANSGATTGNIKLKTLVPGPNVTFGADSNGNLQISASAPAATPYSLPAATANVLGGVMVGAGLTVSVSGLLSANVDSVNGMTGNVVLAANNITTGNFSAAVLGTTPGDNMVLTTDANGNPQWISTIPMSMLPGALTGAVVFQGTFVPGTSTLAMASSSNKGWYYVASAAGTYTPPGGTMLTFQAGDWLISDGTAWSVLSTHSAVTSVNGQVGSVTVQAVNNSTASGSSLISDSGATTGVIKLKTLVGGNNIGLEYDSYGNLVINNTVAQYTLPAASVSSLGGVTVVPTSGLAVDASGNLSANVKSVSGQTGAVQILASDNNTSSGVSLIANNGATTGNIKLSRLVGGTGVTLALDASGNLVINSAGGNSTPATTTTLGSVTVPSNSGLSVNTAGALALVPATTGVLGGVKAGTGLSIAADGTLSNALDTTIQIASTSAAQTVQYLSAAQATNFDINIQTTGSYAPTSTPVGLPGTGIWRVTNQSNSLGPLHVYGASTGQPYLTLAVGQSMLLESTSTGGVVGVTGIVSTFNTRAGAVTLMASDITGAGGALSANPTFSGRAKSDAFSYTALALGNISGVNTLDLSAASEWSGTLTGATTLAFTNTLGANTSEVVYLRLTNAGATGNSITWPTNTKFAAKTAPIFTASGVDLVGVKYDQITSTYMVFVIGLNIG